MTADNTTIEELERQVAEAQAELEKYQCLLNELPGIYEDKFRQKVRSAAEDIRQLLDERKSLQEQVSLGLLHPRAPEALPPAAAVSLTPVRRSWSYLRLPLFQSPYAANPSFGLPNRLQLGVLFGAGVALVLMVLGLPYLLNRRSLPLGGSPTVPFSRERSPLPTAASLRLEARGGQSWVQVERLGGGIVYDAILESGQNKNLPLGSGLKIRSGRPDLLYVGVGMLPFVRLGAVDDLDWFEFRP
ncbi:hypothetical protein KBY83_02100 [Cyanobium sp. WKJ7-Wakatipu]|uniref:DUF4115 domain-containing protein n=1 Tax=Cyanobium sp. WKJ7-Wakatipu TaxID=2823726 RepID=UPI0020CEFD67|nr:DUF4115 domain-containing protein [Cyanobium sp. WKJ7-Wakatipu]MCP9782111.1 hypothetical protein [Cyanobium sp. WKJ7-Wakatipu]